MDIYIYIYIYIYTHIHIYIYIYIYIYYIFFQSGHILITSIKMENYLFQVLQLCRIFPKVRIVVFQPYN